MAAGLAHAQPYDVVIRNGRIIDGTGSPWYSGDIAIQGGRIAAIGQLAACGNQGRHRRSRNGGGAGVHRHAGTVGTDDPGESASAVEDLSGHHHRDHGRGRLGCAAERRDLARSGRTTTTITTTSHRTGPPSASTSRGSKSKAWASILRAMWALRRFDGWCWVTQDRAPTAERAGTDESSWCGRPCGTERWGFRPRCNMRRLRMRAPKN